MANFKRFNRSRLTSSPKEATTSRIMRSNKSKNTKLELLFRKALWKNDIKGYRLHWKKAPGSPDIAFPKRKLAIFINGCFWHRCPRCNLSLPKSNTAFWKDKFHRNQERDKRNIQLLNDMKWNVIVVWECMIKSNIEDSVASVREALS